MAYPERSIVTVLVADAVSSTDRIAAIDPDDAQQMVDDVLTHIRAAVEAAGGLLVSFAGDGGVAVFGWPDSLEDHADRACEAAWNIQHNPIDGRPVLDPARNVVQFRVGVHSGLVGLRHLELERGSQLDLVGGTVHLAARLEKAAGPGQILISAETRDLCRQEFKQRERTDLPILTEVGSSVVEMCSPPMRSPATDILTSYPHPMIGRTDLRAAVAEALSKSGNTAASVAIIGEPGIGKSRLANAVVDDARTRKTVDKLFVFRGDIQKRSTPFTLLRSLILNALELDGSATRDQVKAAFVAAGIDKIVPPLFGIFDVWLDGQANQDTGPDLSAKQTAQMLIDAFFHAAVNQPTLLLVEDLHFVDPESLICLELMKSARAQLSVLVTGRPEAAYDGREVADTVFRIDPLTRDEMRELALELWTGDVPSEHYLEKALDQADGIPFVLEQLACTIEPEHVSEDPTIPQSVQSMIHARINRLPPQIKYCAQGLSILGEDVELDFAGQVLGLDKAQLAEAIGELEKLAITHPVDGKSVRFRHNIIASACAITVPRARRVDIHRAAIETIKAASSDLGGQYERLAFHAEEAGDDEAALDLLYFACSRASRSAARKSLLLNFERALNCIDRLGEPAEETFVKLVQMVCAPLLQHGEFSQMRSHLPRAMDLAVKHGHRGRICAAKIQAGTVNWFDGAYRDGIDLAEASLSLADELDSLPHRYAAQHLLSVLNHATGNLDRAIELQQELCDLLTGDLETARLGSAGIPAAISRAFMGWFLTETGRYEESDAFGTAALKISRRCDNSYTEGIALNALGRNHLMAGNNAKAIAYLQSALALIDRHGYDAPRPHVAGLLASALARGGRAEEALTLAEECFDKAMHLRTGRLELFYLYCGYAEALFQSGAVERSFPAVDQALEIARGINNPCLISQGLALRARFTAIRNAKSPLLVRDRDEHLTLCKTHGLKTLL